MSPQEFAVAALILPKRLDWLELGKERTGAETLASFSRRLKLSPCLFFRGFSAIAANDAELGEASLVRIAWRPSPHPDLPAIESEEPIQLDRNRL